MLKNCNRLSFPREPQYEARDSAFQHQELSANVSIIVNLLSLGNKNILHNFPSNHEHVIFGRLYSVTFLCGVQNVNSRGVRTVGDRS